MSRTMSSFSTSMLEDGSRMLWGTATMGVPEGGKHVRQVSLFLPPLSKPHVMTTTLYSSDSTGAGFVIFNIKKVYEADYTQIAITAQNMDKGEQQDWEYLLDFIVIDRPNLKSKVNEQP